MTPRRGWYTMPGYGALLLLTCLSCTDRMPTAPGERVLPEERPTAVAHLAGRLECSAVVAEGSLSCRLEEPRSPAGISAAILGNAQAKMASSNVQYDSLTTIFSFDATVENLLAAPMGTPDGSTKSGIKVVYHSGPVATSYYAPGDTGTIVVVNADGRVSFTRPDQPYHLYDTILAPGETSAPLNWQLAVPRTVASFDFTVFVFAAIPGEPRVPAVPPDTTPAWVYADSMLTDDDSPHMSGRFPRNVLWLDFYPGTTQEEKQAAIDYIGGEVVGGSSLTDTYVVRVHDDGTTYPLFVALEKLKSLPQILSALPGGFVVGTHLRPADDSIGWRVHDWKLNADSANGVKWGLERISAPLAWGCETGDSTLKVAVVDNGFQGIADLWENTPGATAFGKWPNEKHGTQVASVLGARGDNGVQMTGVMWRAHLNLYDSYTQTSVGRMVLRMDSLRNSIVRAGRASDIINLSSGLYWEEQFARPPYKVYIDEERNPARDSLVVSVVANTVRLALLDLEEKYNRRPLIVISASNDGIDAYWSGVANVAAYSGIADRVIVVGASNIQDKRSVFSNHNVTRNLVGIMAPGEGVASLDHTGTIIPASGASVAAPFVTGLAGLLKSFDPRLTAEELKQFIVEGAIKGGRTADGIPIINAYESLKRAAQRPGAPLCGNRVWVDGGMMKAQRGQVVDNLFQVPALVEDIAVLHGGERIRLRDKILRERREWRFQNSAWTEVADPPSVDSREVVGAYTSLWGFSHDADSIVTARESFTDGSYLVTIEIEDLVSGVVSSPVTRVFSAPSERASECGHERGVFAHDTAGWYLVRYDCEEMIEYVQTGSWLTFDATFSPVGDKVILAVSKFERSSGQISGFEPCEDTEWRAGVAVDRCRTTSNIGRYAGYQLYSISLSNPSDIRLLWSSGSGKGNRSGGW